MEVDANKIVGSVLVVDDDENALEILSRMLGREGHTVLSARSGVEALKLLETQTVEMILLDVMMPGMDGFEVCERLQKDPKTKKIPVVLLTAKDDLESRVRGMGLGVARYLTKPVNRLDLLTTVREQLHAQRIYAELEKTARGLGDESKSSP